MANRFDKIFSEKLSAVIAITSLICLLVSIYIFIIHGSWQFSPILDEAKVAQFGDFVGGVVGTLLAFVAAILYYVALKEQRKYNPQNHPNNFSKRNGSVFFGLSKRNGSV